MTTRVALIVSIDTEEDNWEPARGGITVENIREVPRLDRFFERVGARATYFTSYQVAITPWAAGVLRGIATAGRAEIGAHLHPWNTPPLEEAFAAHNTMTMNLAPALQLAKIRRLTDALEAALGQRPVSFRTGRWALGAATVAAMLACGYRVDSSVTPFISWQPWDDGPSHVGAPCDAYRLDGRGDPRLPVADGRLVEVPISCGYSRLPWAFWAPVHRVLAKPALKPFRLAGIAARLGVIKRIILSPETDTAADMLVLARRLIERGDKHLHLTWHSPSLRAGMSPYTPSPADVERLYGAVESFLERLSATVEVRFVTVWEAAGALAPA